MGTLTKKALLLFAAIICIGSAACCGTDAPAVTPASSEEAATVQTDSSPDHTPESAQTESEFYVCDFSRLTANGFISQIYETDASLYYLCEVTYGEYMVYFTDKEYKDWMPLCFRPDCKHRDANCNAHLEGNTFLRMLLYGDRIYYFTLDLDGEEYLPKLWCMKLDGSEHELLYTMQYPEKDVFYTSKMWNWMFFNKYVGITFVGSDSSSQELESVKGYSYLIDLSKDTISPEPYGYVDENGEQRGFATPLVGRGDIMYGMNEDENNALYRFDVTAGTAVKLCELPMSLEHNGCWLDGDRLYLCKGWSQGIIVCVDINTGEYEIIAEAAPQEHKWYYPYKGYTIGVDTISAGEISGTEICSISGETLYTLPYEDYNAEILISYIIGDYVLAYEYKDGDEFVSAPPTWYLDIRDIGTDRLAWRRWAPEG